MVPQMLGDGLVQRKGGVIEPINKGYRFAETTLRHWHPLTGFHVDAAAFPGAFVEECKNDLDVDVDVWPTRFLGREAGEWYAK